MVTRAQRMRLVRGERDEPYDDTVPSALRVRLDGATGIVSVGATAVRFEPAPCPTCFLFFCGPHSSRSDRTPARAEERNKEKN